MNRILSLIARLRVCAKIASDFGGSAAGPDARRKGGSVSPRDTRPTEPRSRWPGAAPPLRAGGLGRAGFVAPRSQTARVCSLVAPCQPAQSPPAKSELFFAQTPSCPEPSGLTPHAWATAFRGLDPIRRTGGAGVGRRLSIGSRCIGVIVAGFWFVSGLGAAAADGSKRGTAATAEICRCAAGDLEAVFRTAAGGIQLESLEDARTRTALAVKGAPLFSLHMRRVSNGEERTLTASDGWGKTSAGSSRGGFVFEWAAFPEGELAGLTVRATARLEAPESAIRWALDVENRSADWSVRRCVFPQLDLAETSEDGALLFPRGPGEVQRGAWRREFHYRGNYPSGWCSMQFLAAYREGASPTGLYVGLHDPWGSTKHLDFLSTPKSRTVRLSVDVPAADMNQAGNDFRSSGEVVWRLLRGDWYDAARIYRSWARKEARWWPSLGPEGRADTPLWMRELSAWVMTGGAPEECLPAVKAFRAALGLPVGFHWYRWHQIPFDNDYPHYFPTKTGFAQGVGELQRAGVFVMPYINGRLWDSKDGGAEDLEFSRVALGAATKKEDGQPFLEQYGSKETNGEPVSLAVMCPATKLWKDRVRDIVLRLQRDEGTLGAYIDQIAAAAPTLCMDKDHGHPLGGGRWWTQGYWDLLDAIRVAMPPGRMLTSECNAESFVRWFDGYLTWHWQYPGQVPAFPAIYGGAVQMFGRAYRGGPTQDLAMRMKAGQQLVFGEQIGWFDPKQAVEPQNLEFLRKAIQVRWNHRRYFYAGEMARPPRLSGDVPQVRADWQWSGEWPVTTDAVLTGAWRLPAENRVLLLFANVSDSAVKARCVLDLEEYGLTQSQVRRVSSLDGVKSSDELFAVERLAEPIEFAAKSVVAWELIP